MACSECVTVMEAARVESRSLVSAGEVRSVDSLGHVCIWCYFGPPWESNMSGFLESLVCVPPTPHKESGMEQTCLPGVRGE